MSLVPLLLCGCLSLQGPPQAAIDPPAEFVLAATTELRVEALLLGDGGLAGATPAVLQCAAGSCRTPGGIVVEVKTAGVKLTFPSGRELLYTPSGWLHLRGGEAAGPYLAGLELLLADGARLRIDRTGSRREPLQEVLVTADGRSDRLWLQNRPVLETARPRSWSGQRLLCCGHGDAVYHGIALGPLLVFERVLVAAADAAVLPAARMALLVPPIVQSLQAMPVHLRGTGATDVRAGLVGLAEASAGIFAANMPAP